MRRMRRMLARLYRLYQIGKHTSCVVLYRHVSSDNHFEAVSWKPSRGGTPLTTSFLYSHEFIVALLPSPFT